MTAHQHPAVLPKGHRIGEYEIVRVLGAGGFGVTYLAFDHQLDGPVALKEYFPADAARRRPGWGVAPSTTGNQALFTWGLDRFIDEARSLHRLRHANIVRAHRYIQTHGTAYIVMEYVEGESLQQILRVRGRLTPDAWRRWLDPLIDGLAHVHGHGYLHRDLKPANIMIRSADGTPVLIDFGAARVAARERTHTQVLTPGYAPLEQYSRDGGQGPPTDIYALAAVSYRVLTGKRLSSAPDRVLADDYEPLANRIDGADRRWLAAIDHGLALRPEDRPQTVPAWTAAMRDARSAPVPDVDAEARPSRNAGRADVPRQDDSTAPGRAFLSLRHLWLVAVILLFLVAITSDPPDRSPASASGGNDLGVLDDDETEGIDYLSGWSSRNPGAGRPQRPGAAEPTTRATALAPTSRSTPTSPPVSSPEAGEARLELDRPGRRVIQRGLRADDPGSVDGLFGPATRASLRAWQRSRGQAATGYLNGQQAGELRDSARRQQRSVTSTPANRSTTQAATRRSSDPPNRSAASISGGTTEARSTSSDPAYPSPRLDRTAQPQTGSAQAQTGRSTPSLPPVPSPTMYTRGSHQDDVLRIQGTPDEITRWEALGHEVWDYGRSRVTIATRSRQVLQWANRDGNLKVRLAPGPNATNATSFTRGSHQDDVLRIQGTPDEITPWEALGHEVWNYGRSRVTIATRSRQVLQWANRDGNLKVRQAPVGR